MAQQIELKQIGEWCVFPQTSQILQAFLRTGIYWGEWGEGMGDYSL